MANEVVVHKGRTNVIVVRLGYDASADTWTSEIRTQAVQEATLIATWDVDFVTDGVDGELRLTLDDIITGQINQTTGYMDLKRVSSGEPIPVFDRPLEVIFRGTVTE